MLKLFDFLNLKKKINPSDCKLHLACWNGSEHPIDEYFAGTFEKWQSLQTKKNFERKYIVSLIQLPVPNQWLFVGVFEQSGREKGLYEGEDEECYRYNTTELQTFTEFAGRLVLSFQRSGRQSYLYAEKWAEKIHLREFKADKIVVGKFPGYSKVLISKKTLDTIVNQKISSWESALSNIAGIYLITDTNNGKHYVGSAQGCSGIWNRWCEYSHNGHGGNKELKDVLYEKGEDYSKNFQYSILEIADIHSSDDDILSRESFWKDVLCSRGFGYNAN